MEVVPVHPPRRRVSSLTSFVLLFTSVRDPVPTAMSNQKKKIKLEPDTAGSASASNPSNPLSGRRLVTKWNFEHEEPERVGFTHLKFIEGQFKFRLVPAPPTVKSVSDDTMVKWITEGLRCPWERLSPLDSNQDKLDMIKTTMKDIWERAWPSKTKETIFADYNKFLRDCVGGENVEYTKHYNSVKAIWTKVMEPEKTRTWTDQGRKFREEVLCNIFESIRNSHLIPTDLPTDS